MISLTNDYVQDGIDLIKSLQKIRDAYVREIVNYKSSTKRAFEALNDFLDKVPVDFETSFKAGKLSDIRVDLLATVKSISAGVAAMRAENSGFFTTPAGFYSALSGMFPDSTPQGIHLTIQEVTAAQQKAFDASIKELIEAKEKTVETTARENTQLSTLLQQTTAALQQNKAALESNEETQRRLTVSLDEANRVAREQEAHAKEFRNIITMIGEAMRQHVDQAALAGFQKALPSNVSDLLALPSNVPVNAATSSAASFFAPGAATATSDQADVKGKKELEKAFGTARANLLHKLILMIRNGANDQVKSVAESLFHVFLQQGYEQTARDIIANSVTDESLKQAILKNLEEELKADNETVLVRDKVISGSELYQDNYTDESDAKIQSCHQLRSQQAWRFAKEFGTGTYFPKNSAAATYFNILWYTLNNTVDKNTQKPFRQANDFGQKFNDAETAFENQYNQGLRIRLGVAPQAK